MRAKSKILQEVIDDLFEREIKGLETYGTTVDRDDYELKNWLQEAYEECLDKCIYLKAAIKKIENAQNIQEAKSNL
jgi:DNA-directed RNA polymerase beta' subunit